jgi:uncharacterized protein YndB with AHSA1/START domain
MANKTKITAEPGGQAVIIEHEFDAPIDKVWRAYTEPDLYIQWMGPHELTGKIDAWEMKPGGKYGYTHTTADGQSFSFVGYRREVKPKERIVETFEWLGLPGHISLNSADLMDLGDGRTKVVATAVFQTPEDRDGMIESGMERGITEGNERLDELLERI